MYLTTPVPSFTAMARMGDLMRTRTTDVKQTPTGQTVNDKTRIVAMEPRNLAVIILETKRKGEERHHISFILQNTAHIEGNLDRSRHSHRAVSTTILRTGTL